MRQAAPVRPRGRAEKAGAGAKAGVVKEENPELPDKAAPRVRMAGAAGSAEPERVVLGATAEDKAGAQGAVERSATKEKRVVLGPPWRPAKQTSGRRQRLPVAGGARPELVSFLSSFNQVTTQPTHDSLEARSGCGEITPKDSSGKE